MSVSWAECKTHAEACIAGMVLALVILIIVIIAMWYTGRGMPYNGFGRSSMPMPVAVQVAPVQAGAAAPAAPAAGKECFTSPYDLDPATAAFVRARNASDPQISPVAVDRRPGKERMVEDPRLVGMLWSA